MKNYEYIAFDMDGTLMNTYEGVSKAITYTMDKMGKPKPTEQQIRPCIGPPLDDSYKKIFGFTHEEAIEGVAKFREYYRDKGQFECHPYSGITDTLAALNDAGYKLFVATSKLITPALEIVRHFGLDKYFCHVEGTPPGYGDCSKADVLRNAFSSLGITDKSKVILVGDTKFDVIGAKEAGIECMGVLYGFGSEQEFKENGADYIVETTADIADFFLK